MTKNRKFRDADYAATEKMQITLGEALPEGHLARFIVSIVALLELYGYASSIFSSRRIERATDEMIAFR